MNLFTEVKNHVGAAEVARFYGLQINKNKMACCPFHNDKHPSMKIDKSYYCFGYGEKGDAINYVAKIFGLSQIDAAKKIISDMNIPIQMDMPKRKKKPPVSIRKKKQMEELQIEEIKERFQQWCIDKTHKFLDALNLIQTVKEYLSDKEPDMVMDNEAFTVMLHAEPILNYWLDILCFGTEEEQKEFFLQKRKEVTELEQKLFRAGKIILETSWDRSEQRKCG